MADESGAPFGNADPFARRLIGKYVENRQMDIQRLGRAIESSDFNTVRITGHNMSGSGAAYGLDDISVIGARLERAAEASDMLQIERLVAELKTFLANLKAD